MLAKPRWPINVSEGSHLFLISSHLFSAELVMTYKSVSYYNFAIDHKNTQAVACGQVVP